MSCKRRSAKPQLRRSFSEQLRDSTAKAWDLLWKNVRERRLAVRRCRGAHSDKVIGPPSQRALRASCALARRFFNFPLLSIRKRWLG
ncbi:UNVERIFIED_CONTAM: hypothetical protein K2H54_065768 [Gekko kuhli]